MLVNYHTHTKLCGHADGETEDYVKFAVENHFDVIGISDHGPIPIPTFYRMSLHQFEWEYLPQIECAIEKYHDKIKIYKALEVEYVDGQDAYYQYLLSKLDYLVLGLHYFSGAEHSNRTSSWGITNSKSLLEYRDLLVRALSTGYFKVMAHPDIFMASYPYFDKICMQVSMDIIQACIQYNVIIEYNANGIRKGKKIFQDGTLGFSYPNENFWRIAARYPKLKVIVSSDSHSPKQLFDEEFVQALKSAKDLGLNLVYNIFE